MFASWLPLALFALVVWSVQRVVTKVALIRWSTARFYRLNAIVSLAVYAVFAIAVPPDPGGVVSAVGLSLLMAGRVLARAQGAPRGPGGPGQPPSGTRPRPALGPPGAVPGMPALFQPGL